MLYSRPLRIVVWSSDWCRRGPSLFLSFNRNIRIQAPQPAFTITVDFLEYVVLQKVVTYTALPANRFDNDFEIGV